MRFQICITRYDYDRQAGNKYAGNNKLGKQLLANKYVTPEKNPLANHYSDIQFVYT